MESQKIKILVVDDDSMMHTIVRFALNDNLKAPFTLESAMDGAEAKKKYNEFHPDLVITDIVMPDMDGFDLTIYLKTSDPAPFVIVMSGTDYHNLHMVEKLGPDHVLHKDDLMEKLPKAINEFTYSLVIH